MPRLRVLVTGSSGYLGHHVVQRAEQLDGFEVVRAERGGGGDLPLDLDDPATLRELPGKAAAAVVLHTAAMSRMGDCAADPARAQARNATAVAALGASGVPLLAVSTDLVFDGTRAPYTAGDETSPLSVYGASKRAGELEALAVGGTVVRLPLLFGPSSGGDKGATDMLRAAHRDGRRLTLFTDEFRTPLHVVDAADALLRMCRELPAAAAASGIRHVAGPERISRYEFAARFAARWPAVAPQFAPVENQDPTRPPDVSLQSDVVAPRSLDEMLAAS